MATAARSRLRDAEWQARGILSGFIATIVMGIVLIIGFVVASSIGVRDGNTVSQWFYGLAHNKITTTTQNYLLVAAGLYLAFGLIWAAIYAYFFEPLLAGPGWQKGLAFSMLPFLLSIVVFLPSLGGGILGKDLGAGPLPVLGNLVLHIAYGLSLGAVYEQLAVSDLSADAPEDADRDVRGGRYQRAAMRGAQRYSAIGILAGIAIGAILGSILGQTVYPTSSTDNGQLITGAGELSLAGAVLGAGLGALFGSLFGLDQLPEDRS